MVLVNYDDLKQFEKDYSFIPVAKEIYADSITPIILLRKLAKVDKNYYLLESVEGGEKWGRYSFLGYNPLLHVTCKDHQVTMKSGDMETTIRKEPMEVLRELLVRYKAPSIDGYPSFAGGFVGYFSYEMVGYTEPKLQLESSEFHDYELMMFHKVIAFDHLKQKIIVVVNYKGSEGELGYQKALVEIEDTIRFLRDTTPLYDEKTTEKPNFTCNVSKEDYCNRVQKVKKHIKEGDIFQAVISRRFEAIYKSSLLNAYRVLRTSNPSPYMYYLHSEHVEITGASPETLVKLYKGKLTTFPVAGTRPRGMTQVEDLELEKSLLEDEKELSEHNMLVDLARNDIGKVSKYQSVKVEDYMSIHRFSKVMHIASTVTGEIRNDKDGCDTIEALLPAGTLSGAPKFRALEIIKELETVPRGVYGGAIGYLDFSGNIDVCIAIRTAVKKGDKVYVQAGGGIVYDSVPIKEYEESENKASAVIEAIMRASEVE